ncbi:MAG: hypothetical protein II956_16475 [Bacteroidales bacterium]|nr:hypothetical protein [Bacteroidales bacterium]
MKRITKLFMGCMIFVSSCNEKIDSTPDLTNEPMINSVSEQDAELMCAQKNKYLKQFSVILSKAVARNKDVRLFLKNKALEKIDNNYNVFYPLVKNELINGLTFENILAQYADDEEVLSAIETIVPLLNIHFPELLGNRVENIDEDDELPILNEYNLFFDGDIVDTLAADEIPAYHLLVVTESSSIRKSTGLSKSMNNSILNGKYEYVDDIFNPNLIRKSIAKTSGYDNYSVSHTLTGYFPQNNLENDLLNAYNISKKQTNATRTIMYYNWTSLDDNKSTMRSDVKDCIFRIRLHPDGFDDYESTASDEHVFEKSTTNKKSSLTREQVLKNLLNGVYFKFKIFIEKNAISTLVESRAIILYVKPEDLYDFYINESYQHSTFFGHHSKYTYTLDKEKTKSKWYYPMEHGKDTRLERWDIKQDATSKYIMIFLEHKDAGKTFSKTVKYSQTKAISGKLGITAEWKKFADLGINGELNASNTNQQEVSFTYSYSPSDLYLGNMTINYFDDYPIERIYRGRVYFNNFGSGEIAISVIPVSNSYWNKMQNKSIF